MVELHLLEALDALLWLRSGDQVIQCYGVSAASTSRYHRKCLQRFGLAMERWNGEWELVGDQSLLLRERQVHQLARWRGWRPLRLEASYWLGPTLREPALDGWLLGLANIVGVPRNLQLLQERIVDAWVGSFPDCPGADHPALVTIPLTRMPVAFVVGEGHPLLRRARVTTADVAAFPTLALPEQAYPRVEQALKSLGLWNEDVPMTRYRRELWEGRAERELVVGYGTSFSLAVSGQGLHRLPLQLPFEAGDALVLQRCFLGHPRLRALLRQLHARLAPLVERHDDVRFDPVLLEMVEGRG